MVSTSTESILHQNGHSSNAVINISNNFGWVGNGICKQIHEKWKTEFNDYHEFCKVFADGHEHEILGFSAQKLVSPNLFIIDLICQVKFKKSAIQTDWKAMLRGFKALEKKLLAFQQKTDKNWTIHIPMNGTNTCENKSVELFEDIVHSVFDHSALDIVMHY